MPIVASNTLIRQIIHLEVLRDHPSWAEAEDVLRGRFEDALKYYPAGYRELIRVGIVDCGDSPHMKVTDGMKVISMQNIAEGMSKMFQILMWLFGEVPLSSPRKEEVQDDRMLTQMIKRAEKSHRGYD
jgi:hypothetical protein